MSNIIPFILAWIVIAIPVFFFAYGIFLIRENKVAKYPSIYGRAALMIALFALILGSYILFPFLIGKASQSTEYAVEGTYRSASADATITLRNGTVEILSSTPENNIYGNYSITTIGVGFDKQFESGLNSIIGEPTRQGSNKTRMLTVSWIDSSAYKKALSSTKSSKRKNLNSYSNRPKYRTATWWIETKFENELRLIPTNNSSSELLFTKM